MTSRPLAKGQQRTFKLQLFLKKIKKVQLYNTSPVGGKGGHLPPLTPKIF